MSEKEMASASYNVKLSLNEQLSVSYDHFNTVRGQKNLQFSIKASLRQRG